MKLVKIQWVDILNENSWVDFKDLDEKIEEAMNAEYYSVGYLYKETKEYVCILPSISLKPNKELDDTTYEVIPRGVIKKITVL